jgi:hypothetical protein
MTPSTDPATRHLPVAQAAELLSRRWTTRIITELDDYGPVSTGVGHVPSPQLRRRLPGNCAPCAARKEPSASSAKTAHQHRHRLPTHRLRSRQALTTLGIR